MLCSFASAELGHRYRPEGTDILLTRGQPSISCDNSTYLPTYLSYDEGHLLLRSTDYTNLSTGTSPPCNHPGERANHILIRDTTFS